MPQPSDPLSAGPLLDWSGTGHYDPAQARPCHHCGIPTHLRDHKRRPAHKVCTEQRFAEIADIIRTAQGAL